MTILTDIQVSNIRTGADDDARRLSANVLSALDLAIEDVLFGIRTPQSLLHVLDSIPEAEAALLLENLNCMKGYQCGRSCIARAKECRVGTAAPVIRPDSGPERRPDQPAGGTPSGPDIRAALLANTDHVEEAKQALREATEARRVAREILKKRNNLKNRMAEIEASRNVDQKEQELIEAREKEISQSRNIVDLPPGERGTVRIGHRKIEDSVKQKIETGIADVEALIDKDMLARLPTLSIVTRPEVYADGRKVSGYALGDEIHISSSNPGAASITVHEICHPLEKSAPGVMHACADFLKKRSDRTSGRTETVDGITYHTDSWEEKGGILYTGRETYRDGATEILTTGMERMAINPPQIRNAGP